MDALDLRLLREMFPGRLFSLRGIDPRLSDQQLARNLGVSRGTVGRRLTRWRTSGFWKGLVAYPNPEAIATSFQMQGLVLGASRDRSRLESALDQVLEPAFSFQTENFYNPVLFKESKARMERRQRALARLGVCQAVCPPLDISFVASNFAPTRRDWQIIRALRKSPGLHWPTVAREVNVTVRGLLRRIGILMDARALFFFPNLDFRGSPGTIVTVGLMLRHGVDLPRVEAELTERYPDLFPIEHIFPFEKFLPPGLSEPVGGWFQFFLPIPNASSGDRLRRELSTVPGVLEVLSAFPTQNTSTAQGFDRLISAALDRLRLSG